MSWTLVFTSSQEHIIEIAKSILSDHGIECVSMNKKDSMYGSITEGSIELYIHGDDFIRSKKLLSPLENE